MKFTINIPNFNFFRKSSFPKINQVILIFIFAEFILTTAAGLITPVFAIFIVNDIAGSTARVVGFAVAIYWIVKSVLQLPIARQLDKNHGEIDDFYSMLLGIFINTVCVFLFYFVTKVWQVYALQFFIAVGDSFIVPPFYAIFSRHLDKEREGFEWALRSSFSLGAGSSLGGIFSGILAIAIGIRAIYLINGALTFIGLLLLLFLRPYILPKVPQTGGGIIVEQKRL